MASELKPCPNPWCRYDSEPVAVASQVHLECGVSIRHACGIMGPQAESEEEAIAAWNTRPVEDALVEALKAIRDEWDDLAMNQLSPAYEQVCTALKLAGRE